MKQVTQQPYDKVFTILRNAISSNEAANMSQIAQSSGIPLPTVHRLVGQLETRGLLKRLVGTKRFVPGPALIALATDTLRHAFAADEVRSRLLSLSRQVGEHCQLGINANDEIVYVETARAKRSGGLYFETGGRSPLHCSSTGKLFLAELSPAELSAWLKRTSLEKLTKNTVTTDSKLKKVLEETRRKGWASSDEELVEGVIGCAVPIRNKSGVLIAGLGVSAPSARLTFQQLEELIPLMRTCASGIATTL